MNQVPLSIFPLSRSTGNRLTKITIRRISISLNDAQTQGPRGLERPVTAHCWTKRLPAKTARKECTEEPSNSVYPTDSATYESSWYGVWWVSGTIWSRFLRKEKLPRRRGEGDEIIPRIRRTRTSSHRLSLIAIRYLPIPNIHRYSTPAAPRTVHLIDEASQHEAITQTDLKWLNRDTKRDTKTTSPLSYISPPSRGVYVGSQRKERPEDELRPLFDGLTRNLVAMLGIFPSVLASLTPWPPSKITCRHLIWISPFLFLSFFNDIMQSVAFSVSSANSVYSAPNWLCGVTRLHLPRLFAYTKEKKKRKGGARRGSDINKESKRI